MINLLPEDSRKEVNKYYRSRLLVAVFMLTLLLIILSIGMLVPSYIIFSSKAQIAKDNIQGFSEEDRVSTDTALLELQEFRRQLVEISPAVKESPLITEKIALISSILPSGISIDTISITNGTDFELRGVALKRNDITTLTDSLKSLLEIGDVNSPLSNLIAEEDGVFVLTFSFNE